MIQIYVITSDRSKVPLGEVRTDGHAVDFIVDNTEGQLPKQVGGQFEKLKKLVERSSHMSLEHPKQATPNLLRYVMDNGDSVEITTDGKTCILNGNMLDEQGKQSLFDAMRRGEIKVARKATQPVPVMPTSDGTEEKGPDEVEPGHKTAEVIRLLGEMRKKQEMAEKLANGKYDAAIEKADYSYSDDPEFSKNLAYQMKYGSRSGRRGQK